MAKTFEEILNGIVEVQISVRCDDVVEAARLLETDKDRFVGKMKEMVLDIHKLVDVEPVKERLHSLCVYALSYIDKFDKSIPEGKGVLIENAKMMVDLYKRKNHDYGKSFDETMGVYGFYAPAVRMFDKVNRAKTLIHKVALVEDEKLLDTFRDLANYCVLTLLYIETHEDIR